MSATINWVMLAFLQVAPPGDPGGLDPTVSVGGGAIGAFLSTLVVGAILIAVVPDYTKKRMRDVADDPIGSFVYGLVVLLVSIFVIVILAITIIGLFVAIPLAFVVWLMWTVGAVVGYLAIAERFVGLEDGWLVPLVLAAGLNGLLTLTGVGGLIAFCIGAAGFGTVLESWL